MRKFTIFGIVLLLVTSFLGACPAPKPDKEIQLAKEKLELARSEGAPVLSEKEYTVAEKNYTEATNLVSVGKNDEAKVKALTSITNSEIAIMNSRKKKAEEEMSKVSSLLKESKDLRMEVVYPESFKNLTNSYQTSLSLYNSSNYYESLTNSRRVISEVEPTVRELKDKWNTARTELNRVLSRTEKLKRVAKWLSAEVMEIEEITSQAKAFLNEAKLNESIEKSREAIKKLDELSEKLKGKSQQELEDIGNRMKELKINKLKIRFLYFGSNKELEAFNGAEFRVSLTYEEKVTSEYSSEEKVKGMSERELESYRSSLESELQKMREEIRSLYSQAQEDHNKGNYEDSLEKLDRVNELLDMYSLKVEELNVVVSEIEKRKAKKRVTTEPKVVGSYIVEKGDFLSKIAGKLFRGGYWWWPKIFTLNRDKIKDPDVIEIGVELKIPEIPEE
ncbi:MAG: LysM peptidoglycan-binding domain-containing protein [Brevinematia bacterium]